MTTQKQPVLREVLAVEQDLEGNAERTRTQTLELFRSKQNQFTGIRRTFRPFAVAEDATDQGGERLPPTQDEWVQLPRPTRAHPTV